MLLDRISEPVNFFFCFLGKRGKIQYNAKTRDFVSKRGRKNKGALVQKKVTFFWVVLLGRGRRKVKGVFVHEKLFRKSTLFFRREYRKKMNEKEYFVLFFWRRGLGLFKGVRCV